MSTPHGSLALLGSLSAPAKFSEHNTFLCAAGAWHARSGIFFHGSISFVRTVTLFYWSVALKSHFEAAYVVSITRFCALRARGMREAGFFSWINFICQDDYLILLVRSSKKSF